MDIKAVKKRLVKLLALTTSPNESEAELAAEKAKEIMLKYDIRNIDVNEKTGEVDVVVKVIQSFHKKQQHWETQLAAGIADAFDAIAIIVMNHDGYAINFVATKTDYEFIIYLFKRLRRVISKEANQYATQSKAKASVKDLKHSYRIGMVRIIYHRLMLLYKELPDTRALVPVKEKAIDRAAKHAFGSFGSVQDDYEPKNKQAYLAGRQSGENVGLGKPLGR